MADTLVRVVVGVLVAAHGLVHLLYLSDDTPQFSFDRSWIVPRHSASEVGQALMVATVVAFGGLAFAVWGVPTIASAWSGLALVASALSLLLLASFWSHHLVVGALIDVGVLAAAVTEPGWVERFVG
jgi:hypothetical protein